MEPLNPPAPIPSTPPQSAVSLPAESPNRRWLLWSAIGLTFLVFGIAIGVSSIKFFSQSPSPSQLASTPSPAQSPTSTPVPDPTADWKTYTNPTLYYSISYPADFKKDDAPLSEMEVSLSNKEHTISVYVNDPSGSLSGNASEKLTPVTNLAFRINGKEYKPAEAYYFPSQKKYRFQGIHPVLKDGTTWNFSIDGEYLKERDIEVIRKIISTFKFLDQINDTSNWKTYQNSEFTFKYPSNWQLDSNGKKISSPSPEITLWAFGSSDPMYNECMRLEDTKIIGNLTVKTYSSVATGEACDGNTISKGEKWIVKSGGRGYAPGVQYIYNSTQKTEAEKIFDQILSTFKFLN